MKKLIPMFTAILMVMPVIAFADNVSKASLHYVRLSVDSESVDGYGASFDTAMNDKVLMQLDWFKLSESGVSVDFSVFSAAYAFGSLSEGSFFAGLARFDSDLSDDAEVDLELGYANISGEGLDWAVSIINSDEDLTFKGELHTPSGITLGLLTDGDVNLINIGYHFRF
tara:strand:- start:270 stop:776 length:507 start_codon:yes stop_codon:yes gene_type:complete